MRFNMVSSMSDAYSVTVLSLTAVKHSGSTRTWRRRLQNLDGGQWKDVASRLSAGRLEKCLRWKRSVFCSSYHVRIQRECLQQSSFATILHFCRRLAVGFTRFEAGIIGKHTTVFITVYPSTWAYQLAESSTNHFRRPQPRRHSHKKGRVFCSIFHYQ
jgi:hypothetical protein